MDRYFYDMNALECDMNYRWLQPPQIAYFVSTVDKYGNNNVTPVTLGTLVGATTPRNGKPSEYYFTFSLGAVYIDENDNILEPRQGHVNLQENPECVISYIGYDHYFESTVAGLPLPKGISEMEVAGLTPLPSKFVKPAGIKECAVNMEAKVISSQRIGSVYELYLCKIVAVSVDKDYAEKDKERGDFGILAIDPLFELHIKGEGEAPPRLYYGRLDPEKVHITSDKVGCLNDWIGSFRKWMADEYTRGSISAEERDRLLELNSLWAKNRDPVENAAVKEELTSRLRDLCNKARDSGD